MKRSLPAILLLLAVGCTDEKPTNPLPDSGEPVDSGSTIDNPEIVEFTASASAVPLEDTVELRWKVTGARLVTVFSATEVLATTDELEGTRVSLPLRKKSTFTIRAVGDGPAVGATVEVDVVWPAPTITLFESDPPVSFINGYVTIRWRAEHVEKVTLKENGNVLPNGVFTGASAASGGITAYILAASTSYTIEAENPTATVTEEVIVTTGAPPYLRFVATPRTLVSSATVALEWETFGFTRLELVSNLGIPEAIEEDIGQRIVRVDFNADYYMTGYLGDFAYIQAYASIAFAATEFEPNNDFAFAQYISYEGGVIGEISSENDVDYYIYDHYNPTDLRVSTRGLGSGCDTDTSVDVIEAFSATATTVAFDADDGISTGRGGACGEVGPERDAWANLPPQGTYYIVVRGQRGETGRYFLTVQPEL